MSSRSKERVVTAFRKIFHKSSNNNNNNNNNNHNNNINNNNNDKVDGATGSSPNTNNNNNHEGAAPSSAGCGGAMGGGAVGGGSSGSSGASKNAVVRMAAEQAVWDSPGKRRRQDHKVAPTTGRQLVAAPDQTIRSRRLMKEYREMERLQCKNDAVFTVELVNDSLFEWHVRLHVIDPDSPLAKDMVEMGVPAILLHLSFPDNFPFAPPFMRVVEPRIEKGYVMEGGAICMELLTPRGWASAYTVEAVIMQFAASVVKGQGRITRKPKSTKEFTRRQAEESFRSLVKTHEKYGWVTPALSDG
ncbi:ubiquitin-conjugating enzyme E2Q-like protein CG4502 [Drosophila subpulchrella]|uniref:ubiquitin-conjugating enzyme E2Q-like protein CG4502 n=1 Tax=Drosophila subpulchrella TaxID=1486046 RepID=UPI0018A1AD98|nr:ubiquitin-conjugating enzyme E2Q-like protein CG4502 [Drosophila subpulchrella]XP_037708765.1 ubiquitin-conjugating enzyme E2Q-like protein CG4502 [Drosophila subpulchrella]